MGVGYGCTYAPERTTVEIARDVASEARRHRQDIADGARLMLWRGDTVVCEVWQDTGFFVLAASPGNRHSLRVAVTDADRLAAHVEGFCEIVIASLGHPRGHYQFSYWY
jgi:hypothetical protein